MFPRYWASIARGWQCKISVGVRDMTLTILWKNHCITLINLPWKYHESNSTFLFSNFWVTDFLQKRKLWCCCDPSVLKQMTWNQAKMAHFGPYYYQLRSQNKLFLIEVPYCSMNCITSSRHEQCRNFEGNVNVNCFQWSMSMFNSMSMFFKPQCQYQCQCWLMIIDLSQCQLLVWPQCQ